MTVSRFRTALLLCASLGALSACVDTPITKSIAPPAYETMAPFTLDVAEIIVINDSKTTDTTQKLADAFKASPEAALREWANKRLKTTGSMGSLSLIIKDANVTSAALPLKGGMSGYFTKEQAERLDAYLNVLISVEGGQGQPPAEVTVAVRSSHTIPEKATDAEKDKIYQNLLSSLMGQFNSEADTQIRNYFSGYIR